MSFAPWMYHGFLQVSISLYSFIHTYSEEFFSGKGKYIWALVVRIFQGDRVTFCSTYSRLSHHVLGVSDCKWLFLFGMNAVLPLGDLGLVNVVLENSVHCLTRMMSLAPPKGQPRGCQDRSSLGAPKQKPTQHEKLWFKLKSNGSCCNAKQEQFLSSLLSWLRASSQWRCFSWELLHTIGFTV